VSDNRPADARTSGDAIGHLNSAEAGRAAGATRAMSAWQSRDPAYRRSGAACQLMSAAAAEPALGRRTRSGEPGCSSGGSCTAPQGVRLAACPPPDERSGPARHRAYVGLQTSKACDVRTTVISSRRARGSQTGRPELPGRAEAGAPRAPAPPSMQLQGAGLRSPGPGRHVVSIYTDHRQPDWTRQAR
jgi:hypothetical protein